MVLLGLWTDKRQGQATNMCVCIRSVWSTVLDFLMAQRQRHWFPIPSPHRSWNRSPMWLIASLNTVVLLKPCSAISCCLSVFIVLIHILGPKVVDIMCFTYVREHKRHFGTPLSHILVFAVRSRCFMRFLRGARTLRRHVARMKLPRLKISL